LCRGRQGGRPSRRRGWPNSWTRKGCETGAVPVAGASGGWEDRTGMVPVTGGGRTGTIPAAGTVGRGEAASTATTGRCGTGTVASSTS
jgi:hypothetical protein